jgi:hypothetical protein
MECAMTHHWEIDKKNIIVHIKKLGNNRVGRNEIPSPNTPKIFI